MNTRAFVKSIQGPVNNSEGQRQYQHLENIIFDQERVACTVLVTPHLVSLKTKDYVDFVLARRAIAGIVTKPIVRAED